MKKTILLFLFLLVGAIGVSAVTIRNSYYCFDADGGINYNSPAYVSYQGMRFWDKCNYKGELTEYYCAKIYPWSSYTYKQSILYKCPYGCIDGYCKSPSVICGDEKKMGNEECDLGNATNGQVCMPAYGSSCTYCSKTCKIMTVKGGYCGDGILTTPQEECDDGNIVSGDGCDATCKVECQENWECGAWGECQTTVNQDGTYMSSVKYRTCTDLNSCGTTENKPYEGMGCDCTAVWEDREEVLNIGDPDSEAGYDLQNWGPIEPATHGGNWGYNPTCYWDYCMDGNCRVISTESTGDTASFTLDLKGEANASNNYYMSNQIEIYSLIGISGNDSFDVIVDGNVVYSFVDDGNRNSYCGQENWIGHVITDMDLDDFFPTNTYWHVGGIKTFELKSTATSWPYYSTYGSDAMTKIIYRYKERVITCS